MTIIKMTKAEHDLCEQAMKGEKGEALIDVLTDHLLLKEDASPSAAHEKVGVGKVIKFLRDLNRGTGNFLQTKTD